jgi:hypothetical protein
MLTSGATWLPVRVTNASPALDSAIARPPRSAPTTSRARITRMTSRIRDLVGLVDGIGDVRGGGRGSLGSVVVSGEDVDDPDVEHANSWTSGRCWRAKSYGAGRVLHLRGEYTTLRLGRPADRCIVYSV